MIASPPELFGLDLLFRRWRMVSCRSFLAVSLDTCELHPFSQGRIPAGCAGRASAGLAPRFSRDGLFLAFTSEASNLVANDHNGAKLDVLIKELATGKTTLVSVTPAGVSGNGGEGGAERLPKARGEHQQSESLEAGAGNPVLSHVVSELL
jgi:hypothetical protein